MRIKNYLLSIMALFCCYTSFAQIPVPFSSRLPGGNLKRQGEIVLVGNSILNKTSDNAIINRAGVITNLAALTAQANTPYNGNENNDSFNQEYTDVDTDVTTFSSSSADLVINNTCKKIIYAGLYWSGLYPYERSTNQDSNTEGTPRLNDWNQMKLKVPGGAYVNIVADNAADPVGDEDDIIYNDNTFVLPSGQTRVPNVPYVCYKNVTNLLSVLPDANGTYFAANIRAAKGEKKNGSAAGWSLIIIYESPTLPFRYLSLFDGYAAIDKALGGTGTLQYTISGFKTVPAPFPVRATIGFTSIESERNLFGDILLLKGGLTPVGPAPLLGFTQIYNDLNPLADPLDTNNPQRSNVFNSTITIPSVLLGPNAVNVNTRNPNSTNTLGYDLDLLTVPNGTLANNETSADIIVSSKGDTYGIFLTTFQVDIIAPKIVLTKEVANEFGVLIGNTNVGLCTELIYKLGFQNVGNDNADGFVIRDILPLNITFNPATGLKLPTGVTFLSYDPLTRELKLSVDKSLVTKNSLPVNGIEIKVKVVCTCQEMDDACSNQIQNQAFATYFSVTDPSLIIKDDPSFSENIPCKLNPPSPTNFLVGLDKCDFKTDVVICGKNSVTLTAANGYTSYVWTGPGAITPVAGTNNQSVVVSQIGVYTVNDIISLTPCKSIIQTFNVIDYGSGALTNPVIPYAQAPYNGQVVICPNDGKPLPLIFLCGAADSRLIQTSISGAISIVWDQLNTGSCAAVVNPNCANENTACTWTNVGTGPNYTAIAAGQYRVTINYPNGCSRIFYFNVFQNLLNPIATPRDVVCKTQGQITITNVPAGYEYQLNCTGAWTPSNVFTGLSSGLYSVCIRQTGIIGGCPFTLNDIPIVNRILSVSEIITQPLCSYDKGTINIGALNVLPQYTFTIRQMPGSVLVSTVGPTVTNSAEFKDLNPGNYTYTISTQDGCFEPKSFTINQPPILGVSAAIKKPLACTAGEIEIIPTGGTPNYNYIITGAVNTTQSSTTIIASIPGIYNIQVLDANNCVANTMITIANSPPPVFSITKKDIVCATAANAGSITIDTTTSPNTPNGNALLYSIDNGVTFVASNVFTNLTAGTYNVVVQYTLGTSVCTTVAQPITIIGATPIVGISTLTTPYTCTTSGVITVSLVGGGTGPYTYSIDGVTYQVGTTFIITSTGNYTIIIKDSKGCTFATLPIFVAPLTPPTDLTFVSTPLTCPANTSNVTITTTGGSPALSYQIIEPFVGASQVSNVFNNLAPNSYTFEVTDSKNCKYKEDYIIKALPTLKVIGNVVSNVKCFGTSTGSASFAVTGSTGFTYTINGVPKGVGVSPITLVNQPANTYTIVVTNTATSCTDTTFVIIAQPAVALSATVTPTPIKCVPSSGQVLVNATNGWGGYTYVLTPPVGPSSASQMSNLFTGLTQSGTYTVTVTDSGGCTFSTTFPLAAPIAPTLALSVAPVSNFCNTSLSGATLIVTAANGIAPYEFSINGAPYVASNTATNSHTFPNLTASGYTISVRDAYGCTNTAPFTQTIAPQLIINTEFTKELDCSTSPNAVITATAITGGYPAYSYQVSFNGGAYGATVAVVGSSFAYTTAVPGTYQFQVTDTRGCTVLSTIYTVNALIALGETHSQINNKCFADTAGSVTIIPSGGASPYLIQWNGVGSFTSQSNYTGLAAGTYNFIIEDAKFCRRPGSVTITEPNKIVYNGNVNPITCSAGIPPYALGSICVNGLTGGTPPFTYTLVDLTGGTATQTHVEPLGANYCFANIDFGLYNLSVTDANGCTEVKSNLAMASPLGGLNFAISSIASCAAGASLTAAISGGITGAGPYQFGIVDTTMSPYSCCFFNANPGPPPFYTFTGLIPGAVYTIVVRDMSTNCYYFQKAPATNTNSTILPTITAKNVSCRGAADGNLSFSLSGMGAGVTQFTYQIINSATNLPFGGLVTINAPFAFLYTTGLLPVGTYNILIREIDGANGGCGKTFGPFVITQSAADLILSATTTNDNCKASAGLINPTVTGGTGPYTYQYLAWAPLAPPAPTAVSPGWTATNTFNAESGTYDVYVKDAYGCIKTVNVTIGLDATPQITASVVNACAAQGAYQILVGMTTAGIAPYSFSIDGGAFVTNTTPFTISGLSSGVHTVAVKDKNGCGNTVSVTIYSPLALLANIIKEPTCPNNDGEITVLASGGTGPYSYQIITPFVGVPQASGTFSNLGAGTYTISVSYGYLDANTGLPVTCTKTVNAILSLATPVTLNPAITTAVSCNGGSDGTITINLAAGNNNPVYTYQIRLPFVGVIQNSNVFTGLSSGNYTIQVLSGRNCPASQPVTVGTPQVIVANASLPTPVYTCTNNSVNATTITISVISGGTPGFTYSIDGINFFPTNTFNVVGTLLPQNFTYYVKDANGCLFTSAVPITIPAYIPLAASYTTTPISCIANSVLTITASGGSGSYNYQVLPASAANVTQGIAPNQNVFTISGPGSYTFLVTDAITGCFVTTIPYDIPPYNVIDVAANAVKPVTCFSGNDGAISINVTGYSGAYTYTILDSLGNPVLPINSAGNTATNPYTLPIGLSAGNYTVQVSESANPRCVKVSNVVTVTGPSEKLTLTALETANVTCTNNKGVITASATGGWGTYTYSIFPFPAGAVQTGGVFTNLPGGPYTITVRDLLNCDDPKTVILTAPAAISTIFPASPILVDCFGDNTASISFPYPTGGQGSNYSYILTTNNPTLITSGPIAIPAGATTIISGLGANTYSIQIKDGFNCDLKSGNIVVTQPSKISSSLNTKTPISCTQPTELTLTGFGGTPPYSYSTTIGGAYTPFMFPTATDISILPVGTTGLFSYYVKDSKGCITDSPSSVTIKPLDPLSLTLLSKTNVNCFGGSNGVINVVALGGLGNYQYTLLNTTSGITTGPQALGNFANLTAGNYQVSVVSGDCTIAPLPVILNQPPVPFTVVATPNAAKCFAGTDGFINLVMTGGVGVIKYAISPNLNQFITITNPYVLGGFNIPNLVGNTNYTVNVVDENGCLPYTFNFTIGQPLAPLSSNITSIVSEKCAEDNLGEIHIGSIGGGTTPYTITYTVVYPGATAVVTSSIIPLAAGVTTYDFLALNGGAYNVIVTDGNGCKSENSLIVGSGISYKPVAEVTFPCVANKPSVRVEVLNSINAPSFTFNTLVGYSFALDGFPAQSLPTNLTPNVFTSTNYPSLLTPIGVPHVIHVYNTNGCDHDTPVFTISATDVDALNLVLTPVLLNQIVATLNPTTGGAGPYTYTFEDEKGSIVQTGSSNIYVYDHSATYTVTVTDSSECSNTAKIPVVFIPIKITNVYTPGDGGGWSPLNTSNYPNLKTRIYDRYGRLIVTLPEGRKWYGKYNGLEVPSGDYWYVVKVDENNAEEFVGHFTLYR